LEEESFYKQCQIGVNLEDAAARIEMVGSAERLLAEEDT